MLDHRCPEGPPCSSPKRWYLDWNRACWPEGALNGVRGACRGMPRVAARKPVRRPSRAVNMAAASTSDLSAVQHSRDGRKDVYSSVEAGGRCGCVEMTQLRRRRRIVPKSEHFLTSLHAHALPMTIPWYKQLRNDGASRLQRFR
jgi:hypothetical protein